MPNATARSRLPIVALLAVAAAVAFLAFRNSSPPLPDDDTVQPDPAPPDPRTAFPTPYRNVRPEVKFVGDSRCAGCHEAIDKTYHAHPMGRSAAFVSTATSFETFDEKSRPRFARGEVQLRVERTATGFTHVMSAGNAPAHEAPAHLAIGSGARGRSYLTLQSGALWQTPISWFTSKNQWDVSPGFNLDDGGRRAIVQECLFCHVDRVEHVPGSVNRYREPLLPVQAAIGCERCHGPGELHVAERTLVRLPKGEADTSIVNPRRLPAELQTAICAQCHLQGQERILRRGREWSEFRPGLPLEAFVTVFTRHPDLVDWRRSVGQFEQMQRSECFKQSNGKLGCTSCHDPHDRPADATKGEYFRSRCLTCHEKRQSCSAPLADRRSRRDACAECHMPTGDSSNIAHASVTDHRIEKRVSPPAPPVGLHPGNSPLVRFATGPHAPEEAELERDLGVALARLAASGPPRARESIATLASERLDKSLTTWRGDAAAWLAQAHAKRALADMATSRKAAANAFTLEPDSEAALGVAADLALNAKDFAEAERLATRLIGLASTDPEAHVLRAMAKIGLERWAEAEADCRAALALHPLHVNARIALAVCRHRQGDSAAGREEADRAAKALADPRRREATLDWYRSKVR